MGSAEEATNRVLVAFDATGTTGSHVLRQALGQGVSVRAAVRSPDKLPADLVNEERSPSGRPSVDTFRDAPCRRHQDFKPVRGTESSRGARVIKPIPSTGRLGLVVSFAALLWGTAANASTSPAVPGASFDQAEPPHAEEAPLVPPRRPVRASARAFTTAGLLTGVVGGGFLVVRQARVRNVRSIQGECAGACTSDQDAVIAEEQRKARAEGTIAAAILGSSGTALVAGIVLFSLDKPGQALSVSVGSVTVRPTLAPGRVGFVGRF